MTVDLNAWGMDNTFWQETTVTWNSAPKAAAIVGLERHPRAAWWAYQAYAELSGNLVQVTPTASVRGLASWEATTKVARALLGRSGDDTDPVDILMKDGGLPGSGGQVRARVELIPDTGYAPLASPPILSDSLVTPVNGDITVSLPNLGDDEAVFVTVTTPPIYPVADARVRGGDFGNDNYGNETELRIKTWNTPNGTQWSYLKFDLRGVNPQDVNQVNLWLYGGMSANVERPPIPIAVHAVANTSWVETGITWNTKPGLGTQQGIITVDDTCRFGPAVAVPVACWFHLDLTSYVQAELAAQRTTISLGLQALDQSIPTVRFSSRETANQPQLLIT